MKILHISDIHFDCQFLTKEKKIREKLKAAQREAFAKAVSFAIASEVTAVVIAGDLFDNPYHNLKNQMFLIEMFNKLSRYDIKIFYALGNHDSKESYSQYFFSHLPENVFLFKEATVETFEFDQYQVIGCGHLTNDETRNLIKNFPEAKNDKITIGVAHCSIQSTIEKDDRYLPTTIQDLKRVGYDYWAMGHIHKRKEVTDAIYYCGSLQGIHYNETGSKGGILVEFKDKVKNIKTVDFSVINFERVTIELSSEIDNKLDLFYKINDAIGRIDRETIVTIDLQGQTPLYKQLQKDRFIKEINEMIVEKTLIIDVRLKADVRPVINPEEYVSEKNILGYIQEALTTLEKSDMQEFMQKYNIDPSIDKKEIFEEIVYRMVSDTDEN